MGTSMPAASGGAKLPVRKAMIVLGNEPRHAKRAQKLGHPTNRWRLITGNDPLGGHPLV